MTGRNLLSSDSSSQLDVLNHNGDSLSMDSAEVGVFEQTNDVSFGGFLEGEDGLGLESDVSDDVGGEVSNNSLEWKLSDQKIGLGDKLVNSS